MNWSDFQNAIGSLTSTGGNSFDIGNIAANVLTGGFVGFEDGKISKGVLTRGADEAIGEVTGRNAARKLAMQQESALEAEAARQAEQRAATVARQEQQDITASRLAGGYRISSLLQALGFGTGSNQSTNQTDFLGL